MWKIIFYSSFLLSWLTITSQSKLDTVIAKKGDGIFSILRNEGIDPVKYYEEFYKLNEKDIRNGSELVIGKNYLLPDAPDSFKNRGVRIAVEELVEKSIFDKELTNLAVKDSSLKNTVYYLMYSPSLSGKDISERSNNFIIQLARALLVRSAKVYLLDSAMSEENLKTNATDKSFNIAQLGGYPSIVNKKYLMNNGSYQRVIVLQELSKSTRNYVLNVQHYSSSKEGQMLANSLQRNFRKYAVRRSDAKKEVSSFEDDSGIYLAKNILAPVTIISMDSGEKALEKGIEVKSGTTYLAKMITNGILNDYSNNNFSD